eukprot:gb/GECG01013283.1/.p1 GENE.gb/GECG01013283.1/~~gb/GECG01013283.1/.p1  ORF type:complete len:495 (+),score=47.34 gb/GECG01013283.1/:1-1485(+)
MDVILHSTDCPYIFMSSSQFPKMYKRYSIYERYMFTDYNELCDRVSRCVSEAESNYDPSYREHFRQVFAETMKKQHFIPAGNTLLAGKKNIQPNCCIIGRVTDKNFDCIRTRSRTLWKNGVGIGFDLTGLSDPVKGLKLLSEDNSRIDLGHRPQRGNMAVLRLSHPRSMEFIHCKTNNPQSIYNFNISLAVMDEEMDAAIRSDTVPKWLEQVSAAIWATGDPGLVFLDRANEGVSCDAKESLGELETCVPCGEQFMHTNETCNLGSLNLPTFWTDTHGFKENLFREQIRISLRFLDNVVDLLDIPDKTMRAVSRSVRRVGLGVMGFADLLKDVGVDYSSDEAIKWAHRIGQILEEEAEASTRRLGTERGGFKLPNSHHESPRRNLTTTCIAPTGGICLLTGNRGFSVEPFQEESLKISPMQHVAVQATWQQHVENCISKTIGFSKDSTITNIADALKFCYTEKCKGITAFRDGSRKEGNPISYCSECAKFAGYM